MILSSSSSRASTGFQIGGGATSGHYLRGNGTDYVDGAIQAGDVPTLNQNTTGSAASLSISGQTGLLTFTGLSSSNRIKTVSDANDTILELGGSYTPTGTWTSLTLVTPVLGTPASGTLTNCTSLPAASVNSGALANGMTATTQSGWSNDTKLATDAYVDALMYKPTVAYWREDFFAVQPPTLSTSAASLLCDTGWVIQCISSSTSAGAVGVPTASGTANVGQIRLSTASGSGDGITLFKMGGSGLANGWFNMDTNAGWEANFVVQLNSTSNICMRLGFTIAGQGAADAPTDWFGVEYDTANTGNTDSKFTWTNRISSSATYSTTNAINADSTSFHHFRIRSTSAGHILMSADGGTETDMGAVTSNNVGIFLQVLSRTSGTARIFVDFVSFIVSTSRT